jgi:hypothetical protein
MQNVAAHPAEEFALTFPQGNRSQNQYTTVIPSERSESRNLVFRRVPHVHPLLVNVG